jgi:hypothetical protein
VDEEDFIWHEPSAKGLFLKSRVNVFREVTTEMIVYKVFYIHRNDEPIRGEFMGGLIERRKDFRGLSRVESGLEWARSAFGPMVKDRDWIFVVPEELYLKSDTILPLGKKMLNKEEFLWMMEAVDVGIKKKSSKPSRLIN